MLIECLPDEGLDHRLAADVQLSRSFVEFLADADVLLRHVGTLSHRRS
jgi:hypothetical protein